MVVEGPSIPRHTLAIQHYNQDINLGVLDERAQLQISLTCLHGVCTLRASDLFMWPWADQNFARYGR